MKELTERFPEILFEGCAAGGNRFDLGILSYFPQIWASDEMCIRDSGNILPFYNEPLTFETEGPIEIIGPKTVALQGGMGGAYVKSKSCLLYTSRCV